MQIRRVDCDLTKKSIARSILEALPDWFGIPEAVEEYIAGSMGKPFFCAYDAECPVGFLYLKETGRQRLHGDHCRVAGEVQHVLHGFDFVHADFPRKGRGTDCVELRSERFYHGHYFGDHSVLHPRKRIFHQLPADLPA